nr:hypothetical protein [Tanacetum cinerariifolium]
NTIAVKQSNDVTRLQALVDKKKVVVSEATIRDALHLDDAKGVDCLPNEEIFATLARMGYENPSTKLTFYKAFFSSQWKFLRHTILQSISAKRTSWNEFSSAMASAVISLATAREPKNQGDAEEQGAAEEQGNDNTAAEELITAVDDVADQFIQSPTPLTPPPQQPQDIPSTSQRTESSDDTLMEDLSNQGRVIDESDKDKGTKLMNEKEEKETEDVRVNPKDAQVEGRRRRGVVIRDPEEESSAKTPTETKSKDKGKGIMVEEPKPVKKKQQVKLDEAYARKLQEEHNQEIDWEVAMDHVKQKAKENPYNTAGFTLDYFKGMTYDDIRPIFEAKFNANMEFLLKFKEQLEEEESRSIALINETPAQKAIKRTRLNKEAEDVEELK